MWKVKYETREGRMHNAFFDDQSNAVEFRSARLSNHPELYCGTVQGEDD